MTFLEKGIEIASQKLGCRASGNEVISAYCPKDLGLEKPGNEPVCHNGDSVEECERCWNREMPNTEPKADISFVDQVFNAYNDGLNDAWELVNKLLYISSDSIKKELFGTVFVTDIMKDYTPQEALAKMKAYEDSKIEVGDVVKYGNTEYVVCSIFEDFSAHKPNYCGVDRKGRWLGENNVTKTGKHIDIQSILDQIGGE